MHPAQGRCSLLSRRRTNGGVGHSATHDHLHCSPHVHSRSLLTVPKRHRSATLRQAFSALCLLAADLVAMVLAASLPASSGAAGGGDSEEITANSLKKQVGALYQVLKPVGRLSAEQMMQLEQGMLDLHSILNIFLEDPSKIGKCLAMARRRDTPETAKSATDAKQDSATHFHQKYTQFQRVPKKFFWSLFAKRCPVAFAPSRIELIERCDPDAVRKLVDFDTGRGLRLQSRSVATRCGSWARLSTACTRRSASG